MEGYLHRWTNAIFGWQQTYAEVENDEFRYYKEKGGKLQGIISLKGSKIEMIANEPLRIIVQLADSSMLYLKCSAMADKVKWVNALCMAQQGNDSNIPLKEKFLSSIVGEDLKPLKEELSSLLQHKIFSDSTKLNACVTQAWTLQALLESALSDFSEGFSKLSGAPAALKESAENIKRYTSELKHCVYEVIQEIDDTKVTFMDVVKNFAKDSTSPTAAKKQSPSKEADSDEIPSKLNTSKPIEVPMFESPKEEDSPKSGDEFYDAIEDEITVDKGAINKPTIALEVLFCIQYF